jgi:hypothetical protein
MLNSLDNRDAVQPAAERWNVAKRTRALITFGSPLDKTAFLFRAQPDVNEDIREALASNTQPLLMSYQFRPARWINLYSPNDWISGDLNFYDSPLLTSRKQIWNIEDRGAWVPMACHSHYWENEVLADMLADVL